MHLFKTSCLFSNTKKYDSNKIIRLIINSISFTKYNKLYLLNDLIHKNIKNIYAYINNIGISILFLNYGNFVLNCKILILINIILVNHRHRSKHKLFES